MQAFHRFKVFLKRALPAPVVEGVLRLKWEKMKRIDLSKAELIRERSIEYLSNPSNLESELLPALGLNNELLFEMPSALYPYCGHGLLHWQYPNQFSKYLVLLSKLHITSYLEIGVRHGGTFVITTEYLQKFSTLKKAIGVDLGYAPSLVDYQKMNPVAKFFQADTQTERFTDMLKKEGLFDLVLVDGSHGETEVRNDYQAVKDRAGVIVLHDIASVFCPGVQALWTEIKSDDDYCCYEFTEQYEEVVSRRHQHYFGIGVAVKKSYLQKKAIGL